MKVFLVPCLVWQTFLASAVDVDFSFVKFAR